MKNKGWGNAKISQHFIKLKYFSKTSRMENDKPGDSQKNIAKPLAIVKTQPFLNNND